VFNQRPRNELVLCRRRRLLEQHRGFVPTSLRLFPRRDEREREPSTTRPWPISRGVVHAARRAVDSVRDADRGRLATSL
jgi:hypothetical protein